MILVTVGTHHQGFNRLVQAMDKVAESLNEPVVIQRGSSSYVPQHVEHFDFTSSQKMQQLTQEARIIVAHAAAGSALVTLLQQKPLIVVPRRQEFGEHIDDHQVQLANALHAEGKAIAVHKPSADSLLKAIERVTGQPVVNQGANQLIGALREQIEEWSAAKQKSKKPNGFSRLLPFARSLYP